MHKITILLMGMLLMAVSACGADAVAAAPSSTTSTTSTTSTPDNTPATPPAVVPGSEVTLGVGESVRVGTAGFDVVVAEINDSRCPATPDNGIVCVWEGNVVAVLEFVPIDGSAGEQRILEGYVEDGQAVFGETPSTEYRGVEVTVNGITDDGRIQLFFFG